MGGVFTLLVTLGEKPTFPPFFLLWKGLGGGHVRFFVFIFQEGRGGIKSDGIRRVFSPPFFFCLHGRGKRFPSNSFFSSSPKKMGKVDEGGEGDFPSFFPHLKGNLFHLFLAGFWGKIIIYMTWEARTFLFFLPGASLTAEGQLILLPPYTFFILFFGFFFDKKKFCFF